MSPTEACVCFQLPPSAQAQLLLGQVGQVSVCDVLSRVLCSLCVPPCSSLHFKCFVFICFDYIRVICYFPMHETRDVFIICVDIFVFVPSVSTNDSN